MPNYLKIQKCVFLWTPGKNVNNDGNQKITHAALAIFSLILG